MGKLVVVARIDIEIDRIAELVREVKEELEARGFTVEVNYVA